MTLRSNGQFNTTIYPLQRPLSRHLRARMVVLMNRNDMERLGLQEGENVSLSTDAGDGVKPRGRRLSGSSPTISRRAASAAYYPECNPLIPLWHHAEGKQGAGGEIAFRSASRGAAPSWRCDEPSRDDFRFKQRMPGRASSVRDLFRLGLENSGFTLPSEGKNHLISASWKAL